MNVQSMSPILWGVLLLSPLFSFAESRSQETNQDDTKANVSTNQLFDNVVSRLESNYFDKQFRSEKLPAIVESLRSKANSAQTLTQQRQVTHELLSRLPISHLGLLSKESYTRLIGELFGKELPIFGFEVIEVDGMYYVHGILEGGPADLVGLNSGDRILTVDKKPIAESVRLDWRTDDAYLPDPSVHYLLCPEENETIELLVDRGRGKTESIRVTSSPYSSFHAAKASAKIIEYEGLKVGHIHFWFIHMNGVPELLKEKLEGDFAECDALVLDLRGRGGSATEIRPIIDVLDGTNSDWAGKTVALVDQNSRSAKEVLVHLIKNEGIGRIVGHRTAGAVIPATFNDVGSNTMLMFPTFTLGEFTTLIEGIGVTPDVIVEAWRPFRGDSDPILEAGLKECKSMMTK